MGLKFEDKVAILEVAAEFVKDGRDREWSKEWKAYIRKLQRDTGIRIGIDGKLYANR